MMVMMMVSLALPAALESLLKIRERLLRVRQIPGLKGLPKGV